MHIHQTLDSIRKKSVQQSQQHQKMLQQMPAGHVDTITLRAKMNARYERLDYTACMALAAFWF